MKIIGITGTIGAGKGEVVKYFKNKGFLHFSARELIHQEVIKRGLVLNRDTTTMVANDLRTKHGSGYIIESLFAEAQKSGKDSIIESVRALGEVDFLKKQPEFYFLAVDADPKVRYDRIHNRKSALDDVTFEKFLSDEEREMGSTDPTKGNLSGCILRADYVLMNDGGIDELYAQIDKILPKIMAK